MEGERREERNRLNRLCELTCVTIKGDQHLKEKLLEYRKRNSRREQSCCWIHQTLLPAPQARDLTT